MTTLEMMLGEARIAQMQLVSTHCANLRLIIEAEPLVNMIGAIVTKIQELQPGLVATEINPDETARAELLAELVTLTATAADESSRLKKKTQRASAALTADIAHIDNSLHQILRQLEALKVNTTACASERVTALIAPLTGLKTGIQALKLKAQTEAGVTSIRPYRLWTQIAYILAALMLISGAGAIATNMGHANLGPFLTQGLFIISIVVTGFASLAAMLMSDSKRVDCGYALDVTDAGDLPDYLVKQEAVANDTLDLVSRCQGGAPLACDKAA